MNIENVVDIFGRLSGLSAEDITKLRFMCEAAFDYVASRTKSSANLSDYSGRLCFAAAALAYYRFVLWSLTDSQNAETKVGEITVRPLSEKQLEAADKLCKNAFESINEIMNDECFVFEEI